MLDLYPQGWYYLLFRQILDCSYRFWSFWNSNTSQWQSKSSCATLRMDDQYKFWIVFGWVNNFSRYELNLACQDTLIFVIWLFSWSPCLPKDYSSGIYTQWRIKPWSQRKYRPLSNGREQNLQFLPNMETELNEKTPFKSWYTLKVLFPVSIFFLHQIL